MRQVTLPIINDDGVTIFRTISDEGVVDRDAEGNILEERPLTVEEIAFHDAAAAEAAAINAANVAAESARAAAEASRLEMRVVTDALIAWSAITNPAQKYNLVALSGLKTQVQTAMFNYRDVPTEYKTSALIEQYDYIAGRSIEVAFELAAAALQSVGQLQATLTTKGILP